MATTSNGAGSLNNGFSFNNYFYQSGSMTQYAGGAEVLMTNGYNYLDYTPVVPVTFMVPNVGISSRTQFYVGNPASVAQNIIVSGAQGAGFTFNGQNSATVTGVVSTLINVQNVSGVKYLVSF